MSISCGRYAEVKMPELGLRVVVVAVGQLDPQRGLRVDDVHVAELGEREQRRAGAGAARAGGLAPSSARTQVPLAGPATTGGSRRVRRPVPCRAGSGCVVVRPRGPA